MSTVPRPSSRVAILLGGGVREALMAQPLLRACEGAMVFTSGDAVGTLLGLPSVGLHTNGYSLARKLFFENQSYAPDTFVDELGHSVGEALLQPHVSYLRDLEPLLDSGIIKGLAHITGGGLLENIPRILPEGTAVEIKRGTWPVLAIFQLMQQLGKIEEAEMFRTFNMGIGMVIVCDPDHVAQIKNVVSNCYRIGRVVEGERKVVLAD